MLSSLARSGSPCSRLQRIKIPRCAEQVASPATNVFAGLTTPCTASGVVRRHPDVKWLRRETDAAATILTAVMDDPTGLGRVVRGKDGRVDRIVEQHLRDGRPVLAGLYMIALFETIFLFPPIVAVLTARTATQLLHR